VLYAAVSAGACRRRILDRLDDPRAQAGHVVLPVAVWGVGTRCSASTQLWVGATCLLVAGAADSVSAVCRSTILQTVTPDEMRGRMSAIFTLVVAGGPRLGDVESGTVAAIAGTRFSVVSGGVLSLLGILPVVAVFPEFWRYGEEAEA
jgi:MFS-type transporter involved in bile tolerance (Atg22 family)